jgi:hypothetical protein
MRTKKNNRIRCLSIGVYPALADQADPEAGELNGGAWEYGSISLYASDLVLIGLLTLVLLSRGRASRALSPAWYWWAIAGLDLAVFISIFQATYPWLAAYWYLKFLLGLGLFWLVIGSGLSAKRLYGSFLAGAGAQASIAIWQFLTQSSFSSKWLGMAAHWADRAGTAVVEGGGERWLRSYGSLDHPNVLGGILGLADS